jgi:hypothetical protein
LRILGKTRAASAASVEEGERVSSILCSSSLKDGNPITMKTVKFSSETGDLEELKAMLRAK